jgi:TATA-box binding protein (TBP) (component of TFIID and TFIIIB)
MTLIPIETKKEYKNNKNQLTYLSENEIDELSDNDRGKNLKFPEFDDITVSTKTFIVNTSTILDIDKLFNILPITEYIVIPKRRGRKKKNEKVDPNKHIDSGCIITLKYLDKLRGVDLKKKKNEDNNDKKKRGSYFRNSVTVVMIIDGKKINFKVSRNGKFQMTGCKFDEQAERCVKFVWDYIKNKKGIYTLKEKDKMDIIFIPAMRNIDFGLGFLVDREKLDEYFNIYTDFHSLLETSFGYTGVNIKIPVTNSILDLKLKKFTYDLASDTWSSLQKVGYDTYLNTLSDKDRNKKLTQKRYNTFLVFHSGKIIMSGLHRDFQAPVYYKFLDIIRECYNQIEERLDS